MKSGSFFSPIQRGVIIFSGIVVLTIVFIGLLWGLDLVIYPHSNAFNPYNNVSGTNNIIETIWLIPTGILLLVFQPITIFFWFPVTIGNLVYLLFFLKKNHPAGKIKKICYLAIIASLILLAVESYFYFFMQWSI